MNVLYLFLILISPSLLLSLKNKKEIGENIFLALIIFLMLLFIIGILGLLQYSVLIISFISLVCFIYSIFCIHKNKPVIKNILFKPSLIYTIILFILAHFLFRNSFMNKWDEFSHWGIYVKNMFNENVLWNSNFTSGANGYPPIVSIFQYFLMKLNNCFSEADLFKGMFLLSTIPLVSFCKNLSFKKPLEMIFYMGLFLTIPSILSYDYLNSIYVDTVVGIFFAVSVIKLITNQIETYNLTTYVLALTILILMKSIGIVVVGIFYLILLIDIIFIRRKEYIEYYNSHFNKILDKVKLLIVLALPFIFRIIWSLFLKYFAVSSKLGNIFINYISKPTAAMELKRKTYFPTVINDFNAAIFKSNIGGTNSIISIPSIYWIILLIILSLIIMEYLKNHDDRKYLKLSIISIIVSFVLYSGALLYSYLYSFDIKEALILASFTRYMITILIATIMIFIFTVFFINFKNGFTNKIVMYIVMGIIMFTIRIPEMLIICKNAIVDTKSYEKFNEPYKKTDEIKKYLSTDDKVYYISSESEGFDYLVFKYKLTPNEIQNSNYSICSSCSDENKIAVTPENFLEQLKNYDYLFIYKHDKDFYNDYHNVFENLQIIENKTLYKIIRINNKIKLEKVV
ncbi:MAG: hypothetical protein GX032_03615 [Tenericutes bacterium]|nr:hypothetical protein [Mycoplasmatota bacterium]